MKYSIIIPLKNEEENISDLLHELVPVMRSLHQPWEVLTIDDGSTDGTLKELEKLKKEIPELRVLVFDRNYGQSAAFDAGFRNAKGQFIITLDGDRQNDPNDIPKLVSLSEEADLVSGRRVNRQDPISKKWISKLANAVRSRFCEDGIHDTGCSLKLYRKSCFDKIKLFKGMHRFLPALFLIEGFRVKEVPVNHRERTKGQTKYHFFNRSFNTVADMFAVRWMKKRHLNYSIRKEW